MEGGKAWVQTIIRQVVQFREFNPVKQCLRIVLCPANSFIILVLGFFRNVLQHLTAIGNHGIKPSSQAKG
jgi:hypothetical protein